MLTLLTGRWSTQIETFQGFLYKKQIIILVNDDFSQLQEEESGVFKQGGMWSSFKGTRCADFSFLLMC